MSDVLQLSHPLFPRITPSLLRYSYDSVWKYLTQTMVDIPKTAPLLPKPSTGGDKGVAAPPTGTVYVPVNSTWAFSVNGVEIEGNDNQGVDVQYSWETHPQREHSHTMSVGGFYMDEYPVTTTNYSSFLTATGFKPADPYRWLENWNGSFTAPPAALADVPVTYVSLEEARAFCKWRGARLPHSHEWQYAAQGSDGRLYPWGDKKDQSKYPVMKQGNDFLGAEKVTAHPTGASPFGVKDLVGNVYQYTDEFQDDHTRAVILRGGSNYYPLGSHWYLPQSLELNKHEKYVASVRICSHLFAGWE